MGWCGDRGGPIWEHGALNSCKLETVAGPCLVLLSIYIAAVAYRRFREAGQRRGFQIWQMRIEASQVVGFLSFLALLLLHLGWLAYLHILHKDPRFQLVFDLCMAAVWLIAAGVVWGGWRAGISVPLGILIWPALLVYIGVAYTSVRMYLGHWGIPRHILVPFLVVSGLQCTVAFFVGIIDLCRKPAGESEPSLKEALLKDLEKGEPGTDKQPRKWYSLVLVSLLYVWPSTLGMQVRAVICILLVCTMRLLNLAVPIVYKHLVDVLSNVTARTHPPGGGAPEHFTFWEVFSPWVLMYMLVAFLQGGSGGGTVGLISNLRQYLWIPITQQAYRRISLDVFSHTLDLDLNFHLHRKTGEVMRIMDRGTSSVQNILSTVVFNIAPQVFDIVAASVYLATALEPWIAAIVFVTLSSYIPLTVWITEWRGKYRRDLNATDNAKGAKVTDALLNYETVKYFNNEPLERDNFGKAIQDYQQVEYKLLTSLNILNAGQTLILFAGLISGLAVCTKGVANGSLTVGDTVLFITLMQQLYGPLNFFGTYYRVIQQAMIDMENMFDLLATSPQIKDKPEAEELQWGAASVEFDNVSFAYNLDAPILKNVSFSVEAGQTLALVGATGSGKSSVLRLLFRFYEPQAGSIKVNGRPITEVTQGSLRRLIGVVPQDTVLFNETILYNIRYGRPSASDEEVFETAEAACIHRPITTRFPQGYNTVVGERGLRLSGGEKQRVAFARSILKDPPILLLDEATSALDSMTEKKIQERLEEMRHNRTTIIVAHRLSTIMNADKIVVFQEGEVVEMGTHPDLIERGGLYAEMWSRQQEAPEMNRAGSYASLPSVTSVGSDFQDTASLQSYTGHHRT